jgi:hypothetical protein
MRLDLNMLLYALLFLIILGLFLGSLLKRIREKKGSRADTAASDRTGAPVEEGPEGRAE